MNKYKILFVLVTAFCSLIPTLLYSQFVDTAWVRRYNGPGNHNDGANAIAVDNLGNAYVTGYSRHGNAEGSEDYATIKYNSAGIEQWVARYHFIFWDYAYAIAIDGQGNVYVTGESYGSGTYYDYATIKYNSQGVQQWVARYNGPGNNGPDRANAIAVDSQGNVYVTGQSDNNPNIDTFDYDYVTIKYNSAGVEQWVQRYNGPGNDNDWAYSLAVDGQENVYVTGESYGSDTSFDYATIKYNSAGVEQWVQRYNGPGHSTDYPYAIAVDGSANVYVTGWSYGSGTGEDYATIKYMQTMPGIEENCSPLSADHLTLEVFPNPAKSYLTIRFSQSADRSDVKIYDVAGNVVKEIARVRNEQRNDRPGEFKVPLKGINPGIYFLQVNNETEIKKLVITK